MAKAAGKKTAAKSDELPTTQSRERNTITQAISFDWQIYEIMEAARAETRIPTPRSAYIRQALEEKFIREGRMKQTPVMKRT